MRTMERGHRYGLLSALVLALIALITAGGQRAASTLPTAQPSHPASVPALPADGPHLHIDGVLGVQILDRVGTLYPTATAR